MIIKDLYFDGVVVGVDIENFVVELVGEVGDVF